MKKNLLLLIISFAYSFTYAQPVLNSNEMLPFNSIMNLKTAQNYSIIDTTIRGANATWDFTAITAAAGGDKSLQAVRPSATPYAALFPSANYAYVQAPTTSYSYYNLSSTKMERVGSYYTSQNIYTNPQTEYVFPLSMGVINNDTWDNTSSSFGGGNYNLSCIGYGTLKLPGITYNNALMVRVNLTEGTFSNLWVYFWYSSDNGAVLLERIYGDGFFYPNTAIYLSSLVIGVDENESIKNVTYNNPVQNNFAFSFYNKDGKQFDYTVRDGMGKTVLQGKVQPTQTYQTIDMNLESLSQGLYYFSMLATDEGTPYTVKLMKQ